MSNGRSVGRQNEIVISMRVGELKHALAGLKKVMGRGRSIPVLDYVRVERECGVVRVTGTDCQSFATYKFKGIGEGIHMDVVLVPYAKLVDTVKGLLKTDVVSVSTWRNVDSPDSAEIRYPIGCAEVVICCEYIAPEEFPTVPDLSVEANTSGPHFFGSDLEGIFNALRVCSKDQNRYIIQSCYIEMDGKIPEVVGTDGRRLFRQNLQYVSKGEMPSVIIPDRPFLHWEAFRKEEGGWQITVRETVEAIEAKIAKGCKPAVEAVPGVRGWVMIRSARWTYIVEAAEGKYPFWQQVLPMRDATKTEVVFNNGSVETTLLVLPKLPRGTSSGDSSEAVTFDFTLQGSEVRGNGYGSNDPVPISGVTVQGAGLRIGVNREYFADALEMGFRKILLNDELSPFMFVDDNGGRDYVLMPMRLT
jgi:DNA polymerase III sliding clamp (beta) subunit (PCNA family)